MSKKSKKTTEPKTKGKKGQVEQPEVTVAESAPAEPTEIAQEAPRVKPREPPRRCRRLTRRPPRFRRPTLRPPKRQRAARAAKVLSEAGEPMNCQDMIKAMAEKRYWKSPGGQTPAATLYSGILREIGKKGKESRFKKTERGKFAAN
jgi:hypothetical protein